MTDPNLETIQTFGTRVPVGFGRISRALRPCIPLAYDALINYFPEEHQRAMRARHAQRIKDAVAAGQELLPPAPDLGPWKADLYVILPYRRGARIVRPNRILAIFHEEHNAPGIAHHRIRYPGIKCRAYLKKHMVQEHVWKQAQRLRKKYWEAVTLEGTDAGEEEE